MDDLISRAAALDAITKLPHEYSTKEQRARTGGIAACSLIISELPSVSTEKTGRWEFVEYDFDPRIGNWHCSECRNILVYAVKKDDENGIPLAKYCPNCGAKMGVEE